MNACLKETGECGSVDEVAAFIDTLEQMITKRAKQCERLVPALKPRFKGTSHSTYLSATRGDEYKSARSRGDYPAAWLQFVKGCLGLSKNSLDATKEMIFGRGFAHGIVDGTVTPLWVSHPRRCDRGLSRHCAVSLIEPSSQTDREGDEPSLDTSTTQHQQQPCSFRDNATQRSDQAC